jgi:hypothetical protein
MVSCGSGLAHMPIMTNSLVETSFIGRGKMMGVDHNKNMVWVGSSAGLYIP